MSRALPPATDAMNADSFLDIVASVVSIMIIMILMTGLKIKRSPAPLATPGEAAEIRAGLAGDLEGEQSVRRDVLTMAAEMEELQQQMAVRKQERDMLGLIAQSLEEKNMASAAASAPRADVASPEEQARARELLAARARLEELDGLCQSIEATPPAQVQIESYPTPLSQPVAGRELHFQLRGGRLAAIPLDALIERFKGDAEHKVSRLRDQAELTETVGPEGGFRLRYTLERGEITPDGSSRGGTVIRLKRWTLLPDSDELGETLAEALRPGSQFRQVLADRRMWGATVTIWTYPDSFDAFRQLRKELYLAGFPVAGRPLPEGILISGSPHGTKSASE